MVANCTCARLVVFFARFSPGPLLSKIKSLQPLAYKFYWSMKSKRSIFIRTEIICLIGDLRESTWTGEGVGGKGSTVILQDGQLRTCDVNPGRDLTPVGCAQGRCRQPILKNSCPSCTSEPPGDLSQWSLVMPICKVDQAV